MFTAEEIADMRAFDAMVDAQPAEPEMLRLSQEIDKEIKLERLTPEELQKRNQRLANDRERYAARKKSKERTEKKRQYDATPEAKARHREAVKQYNERNAEKIKAAKHERYLKRKEQKKNEYS